MMDDTIAFEDAATLRPDGGHNICYATVETPASQRQKHFDSMQRWFGPFGIRKDDVAIWQIDSEWSDRRADDMYAERTHADLKLIKRKQDGQTLSAEECAQLIEHRILEPENGETQCLWIEGTQTRKALLEIGDRIRRKHFDAMNALKKPYIEAVQRNTPEHLRKMQGFGLQYVFYVDGWFVLYCLKELVNSGRLRLPTEEQRKALTMIIMHDC